MKSHLHDSGMQLQQIIMNTLETNQKCFGNEWKILYNEIEYKK